MLTDLRIAARNLWRNRRRSLTTMAAVAVGCVALIVFGGFATAVSLGLESSIARQEGHLHLYASGYLEYGSANPADFALEHPEQIIAGMLRVPEIRQRVVVAAPVLRLNGIAGNFREQVSKTFLGVGVIPSLQQKMAHWDSHGLGGVPPVWSLRDDDPAGAVIGIGMARMLNLCDELELAACRDRPKKIPEGPQDADIERLSVGLAPPEHTEDGRPVLDLLAATGRGAPNVMPVRVNAGVRQAVRASDDSFVGMHLAQARQLVFGGEDKATAIVLQLRTLADVPAVRELVTTHLNPTLQGLELRDLTEFNPSFKGILAMFGAIFSFVACVIGMVVLFTVANTMTMSVVERTAEVGTLRALGVRRSGIRRQFLQEGMLLGIAGATAGVLVGLAVAQVINKVGLSWQPPSSPVPQPLVLLPLEQPLLPLLIWLAMIAVTSISSLAPANRAARQTIVDAIHHI